MQRKHVALLYIMLKSKSNHTNYKTTPQPGNALLALSKLNSKRKTITQLIMRIDGSRCEHCHRALKVKTQFL